MAKNIGDKAFLIGNGINRAISNGVNSWEDLLGNLSKSFSVDVDLTNEFKPFPLAFEEILFKSGGNFDLTLKTIKEKISESFKTTPDNELHRLVVHSGIENILTTNYDYAFERAIIPGFENKKGESPRSTDETLNSIKRRSRIKEPKLNNGYRPDEISIWHIHGEINQRLYPSEQEKTSAANSIMIGYEHYGVYLGEIQKYIKGDKGNNDKSIIEKAKDLNYKPISWIDFFFMSELHIVGLSFDFSENHLWWLLNYRAKEIRKGNLKSERLSKIYYYYHLTSDIFPDDPKAYFQVLLKRKMNKAKLDLLESLNVDICPITIKMNDYEDYYRQVFNKVLKVN